MDTRDIIEEGKRIMASQFVATWSESYTIDDIAVKIQESAHSKSSDLILTKELINSLSDEQIVQVARTFAHYADEIGFVGFGRRWNWDRQFFSASDLKVVLSGSLATDKEKDELLGITNGEPRIIIEQVRIPKPGFVYLISTDGSSVCKIGMASDAQRRLKDLQASSPVSLDMIHSISTDDMSTLECELHERFADKRLHGEWFDLSSEDIAYIKSL